MHICMYVCMYECMYVCMYVCMHESIHYENSTVVMKRQFPYIIKNTHPLSYLLYIHSLHIFEAC